MHLQLAHVISTTTVEYSFFFFFLTAALFTTSGKDKVTLALVGAGPRR